MFSGGVCIFSSGLCNISLGQDGLSVLSTLDHQQLSDWVVQVSLSHAVSSFKIVFMVWECVFMLSAVTRGGPC